MESASERLECWLVPKRVDRDRRGFLGSPRVQ